MNCGVCEFMCPRGAIRQAKNQLFILKGLCNDCGDCVPYCPARAIVPRHRFHERQRSTVANQLRRALGV
ncbi:MAG: 4Fe-4S binding protein [Dehalococcoidia bacterium]|nr:4Fe-4S binding protein [Dehalococcoidia bacterium]